MPIKYVKGVHHHDAIRVQTILEPMVLGKASSGVAMGTRLDVRTSVSAELEDAWQHMSQLLATTRHLMFNSIVPVHVGEHGL